MNIRPKKRLGQNFLADGNTRQKIVTACNFTKDDVVLEIGAGTGQMTELICPVAGFVYAVEIDRNLCRILKTNLGAHRNIEVINENFLKLEIDKIITRHKKKLKVIGNIPYYITTPIIEWVLERKEHIAEVYLTVQKEFAVRMASGPGTKDYGPLSCFVQYHAEAEILFNIGKSCFKPIPKVDSSLIRLKMRSAPAVEVKDEGLFFSIIRKAFQQRRKTLRNSLKGIVPEEKLNIFFEKNNLDPKIRPEQLSLTDFANIANL